MSCRETKANSACTSFAKTISDLSDKQIQACFHALKKEGATEVAPDREQFENFLRQQRALANEFTEIDQARRRSIIERLDGAYRESRYTTDSDLPDGPTFYAQKNVVAATQILGDKQRAGDLTRRLPGMTPAQVDSELSKKYETYYKVLDQAASAKRDVGYAQRNHDDSARRNNGTAAANRIKDLQDSKEKVASYGSKATKLIGQLAPYEQEYVKRGRWSRFHEVTGNSSQNHVHKSMNCSSCYSTTRYAWHPELSGQSESEAVVEFGEKMCTVCFPSAPANPNFHQPGRRDQETINARQAERAQRAAAKDAKSILRPDGSKLRDSHNSEIKTLRTAQIEHVSLQAYNAWLQKPTEGMRERPDIIEKNLRTIDDIEQAIAHKTGQSVEEIRAIAAPKVAKKVAKGEW